MPTRVLGLSVLEAAVYTRLTTHASTSSYSTYAYVPEDTAMPYIRIGDYMGIPSTSFNNRDFPNEDSFVTIHIWSDYLGNKQCLDMMNDIVTAVFSSNLSITGYETPFLTTLEMSDIITDDSNPNEIKRHGVIRVRISMGAT